MASLLDPPAADRAQPTLTPCLEQMKLAIVTTHPIQYNAPWFRLLAQEQGIDLKVFYTWEESRQMAKYDPGFGRVIQWDIPLLDGYDYTFVRNVSKEQGSHHYRGIDNPGLNSEIEQWGAEAVLVFGWPFRSHFSCMKHFKGKIPVLFRGDSTLLDERPGLKKLLRRIFLRYVYSFVDYCLYVGTNNKRYYLAHGIRENQLVFVPHAVDNERFAGNRKTDAAKWRRELGIDAGCFVVLFAGKLEPKKNPHFILRLAAELSDPVYRFLIVGNGILEQELKARTSDDRIIFMDFQNQERMPVVYRLGDVFVLPSTGPGETWGLAINEAMACGNHVIATDKVGGAIDIVREDENGIIIAPDDVPKAAAYVRRIHTDKSFEEKKDRANRELLNTYSFDSIVNNLKTFLEGARVSSG